MVSVLMSAILGKVFFAEGQASGAKGPEAVDTIQRTAIFSLSCRRLVHFGVKINLCSN